MLSKDHDANLARYYQRLQADGSISETRPEEFLARTVQALKDDNANTLTVLKAALRCVIEGRQADAARILTGAIDELRGPGRSVQ